MIIIFFVEDFIQTNEILFFLLKKKGVKSMTPFLKYNRL